MTVEITYRTPIATIRRPQMADNIRRLIVANALSVIGVEAGIPETRPIFEKLLGPVHGGHWDLDRPFRCYQRDGKWITEGVSTCGLVAEGLWRRAGVRADWLHTPYGAGGRFDSITRARRLAAYLQPRSAWNPGREGEPVPGDYVVIGSGLSTHALTVIGWEGDQLVSVDGGQTGVRGLQAIDECRRRWRRTGTQARLDDRDVLGWVSPDLLPGEDEAVGPVGWESVEV